MEENQNLARKNYSSSLASVVLISHVICHMASFFFFLRKILNNLQTGNGPGKERNQVITFFLIHFKYCNTQSQS